MLTLDQEAIGVELKRFEKSMSNWRAGLKLNERECVKYQAGQLARTLVNLSPPKSVASSKLRLENQVQKRFEAVADQHHRFRGSSGGKYGVEWYRFTPTAMYGAGPETDLRNMDERALYQLFPRITKSGKLLVGKRGKQKIFLSKNILTRKSTRNKLVRLLQSHLGRLKAGWIVAWEACGSPGRPIPGWIARHRSGARGNVDTRELDNGAMPAITISNHGRGVGELSGKESSIVIRALQMRAKAMQQDLLLYVRGKKDLKSLPQSLRGGNGE